MTKTEKQKSFIDLRSQGCSYDAIARAIAVSKPTLLKWSQQFDSDISQNKSKATDDLQTRYRDMRTSRVDALHYQIERIYKELATRNLESVRTPQLVKILAIVNRELRAEQDSIDRLSSSGSTEPNTWADLLKAASATRDSGIA